MSFGKPTPSEETRKYLEKWSQQLGLPMADVEKEYIEQYEALMKSKPGKDAGWYDRVARTRVYVHLKGRRFVRAKPWDGVFVGVGPAFDVTARQREQALEILRTDPERAHREGWVNEQGEPIDMRKTLPSGAPNPFYGRVLQPTFVRQSVAIGRPAVGGDMKLTILHHFRDQAKLLPPLGKPVRFLANLRADEENRYLLNTSVATTFEPVQMPEIGEVTTQKVCDLLLKAPSEYRCNLAELEKWHEEHQEDPRRIVIVEGSVIYVRREPLSTGNYFLVIEDESIMDIESEGVMVWVHADIADQLEFGNGSRVIIVGRTVQGPSFNRETGQIDRENLRTMINAFGVWAEPEYLVPVEEERIIEPTETVG